MFLSNICVMSFRLDKQVHGSSLKKGKFLLLPWVSILLQNLLGLRAYLDFAKPCHTFCAKRVARHNSSGEKSVHHICGKTS
jgi:hypothetical protein